MPLATYDKFDDFDEVDKKPFRWSAFFFLIFRLFLVAGIITAAVLSCIFWPVSLLGIIGTGLCATVAAAVILPEISLRLFESLKIILSTLLLGLKVIAKGALVAAVFAAVFVFLAVITIAIIVPILSVVSVTVALGLGFLSLFAPEFAKKCYSILDIAFNSMKTSNSSKQPYSGLDNLSQSAEFVNAGSSTYRKAFLELISTNATEQQDEIVKEQRTPFTSPDPSDLPPPSYESFKTEQPSSVVSENSDKSGHPGGELPSECSSQQFGM